MSEGSVIFKGSLNGLTIIMKEKRIMIRYLSRLKTNSLIRKFFKGAILSVKYREKAYRRTGKKAF